MLSKSAQNESDFKNNQKSVTHLTKSTQEIQYP